MDTSPNLRAPDDSHLQTGKSACPAGSHEVETVNTCDTPTARVAGGRAAGKWYYTGRDGGEGAASGGTFADRVTGQRGGDTNEQTRPETNLAARGRFYPEHICRHGLTGAGLHATHARSPIQAAICHNRTGHSNCSRCRQAGGTHRLCPRHATAVHGGENATGPRGAECRGDLQIQTYFKSPG